MMEQFHSRPGEIVPGSKNPPLKPDLTKTIREEELKQAFDESAHAQSESLKHVTEHLRTPLKSDSDLESGIRPAPRKPTPLPDSPLSTSGAGNIEVDVDVNREDPEDHEWAA